MIQSYHRFFMLDLAKPINSMLHVNIYKLLLIRTISMRYNKDISKNDLLH